MKMAIISVHGKKNITAEDGSDIIIMCTYMLKQYVVECFTCSVMYVIMFICLCLLDK